MKIPIDAQLQLKVDLEAGNLIHDFTGFWSSYRSWCDLGEEVPAMIWKRGLYMLLRTRDRKASYDFVVLELKKAKWDYKSLEKKKRNKRGRRLVAKTPRCQR